MLIEAVDFLQESMALAALVTPLDDAMLEEKTQFNGWTINDVIQHLHAVNCAATLSVSDEPQFQAYAKALFAEKRGLRRFENDWLMGLKGRQLVDAWRTTFEDTALRFRDVDPKLRVKWFGPDMSARSSITARQMETWAHGQEVFDLLGVERIDQDRIRNIAHLGVSTFAWTFVNRGMKPPGAAPYVRLLAPSGAVWEWNADNCEDKIAGSATEFCQVVAQTRNVADTTLHVIGPVAQAWMVSAQCFAGGAKTPPPPGVRFRRA